MNESIANATVEGFVLANRLILDPETARDEEFIQQMREREATTIKFSTANTVVAVTEMMTFIGHKMLDNDGEMMWRVQAFADGDMFTENWSHSLSLAIRDSVMAGI